MSVALEALPTHSTPTAEAETESKRRTGATGGLRAWSRTRATPGTGKRVLRTYEPSLPFDETKISEQKARRMLGKRTMSASDATVATQRADRAASDTAAYSGRKSDVAASPTLDPEASRLNRFLKLLDAPNTDLDALKKLAWSGSPEGLRARIWKILLRYVPTNRDRREATLQRKRQEYLDFVPQYQNVQSGLQQDKYEASILHQIHIDVPRTNPLSALFQKSRVQESLERILFLWAIRHPASGYVQGINDLATPFFVVFLSEYIDCDPEEYDIDLLPKEALDKVEADSFWCMTNLLNHIQENYTFAQPGIQKMIFKLRELVGRIDPALAEHLDEQEADYVHFAFRWMNCLLMREMPLRLVVRIWDTYLSEAEEFATFHVYVCATFLAHWSEKLLQLEFQDIMLFLQHLPTPKWTMKEVDMLLSQAFLYKSLYHDAPSHLREQNT